MDLKGKVAIVTGGGTGMGKAISTLLAQSGASVAVNYSRSEADAVATAEELTAAGVEAMPIRADVSVAADVAAMVEQTERQLGRVDILVNNAALTGARAIRPVEETDDETLDRIVDVNLKAPFRLVRDLLPRFGDAGVVLNIGSVGAFAAQERAVAYSASKAGLEMLTKALALELAPRGIRVVGIAPGDVATERSAANDAAWEAAGVRHARETPLGTRGRPRDVGAAAVFLASDAASFVTGTTLVVDGGLLSY